MGTRLAPVQPPERLTMSTDYITSIRRSNPDTAGRALHASLAWLLAWRRTLALILLGTILIMKWKG